MKTHQDTNKIKTRICRLYGGMENYEKRHSYGMSLSAAEMRALAGLAEEWDTSAEFDYMIHGIFYRPKGWTGQQVAKREFPRPGPDDDCHYMLEYCTHPVMKILLQVVGEIKAGKFLVSSIS